MTPTSKPPGAGGRIGRRDFLWLAAAGVALPGLAACAPTSPSSGSGTLTVSQPSAVSTLDPQKQGSMTDMSVLINIFDCLTDRDQDNRLVGGLAESWAALEDTRWRFTLRQGVTFHNGEPFNADAVKFSIDRLLDPATKSPIVELASVEAVEVVDEHTVDVVTAAPDPLIPAKVSLFGGVIVPPGYVREQGDDRFAQHPVGTGPFVFESWQRDSEIVLTPNADYWGTKPAVNALRITPTPSPSTAVTSLLAGELDLVSGVTPDALLQLQGNDAVKRVSVPGIRTYYLSLDTLNDGPLANRDVRLALNYGLNVEQLIEALLGGAAQPVPTLIPEQNFGFDPSVEPFPYDPERARELLARAGYADGFDLPITAQNTDADVVQAIAGEYRKLGIRAEARLLDPGSYEQGLLSERSEGLGPAFYVGNTAWTMDAANNLQSYIKRDRRQSRWHNRRADQLIDIEETSMDPERRKVAIAELQQLLKEEAPFVYLYQIDSVHAADRRVRWEPNALGLLSMDSASLAST